MSKPETTYERYYRALERIADGAENARAIADEALRSRKSELPGKWRVDLEAKKKATQHRRDQRMEVAKAAYLEWVKAGCPSVAGFARQHGLSRSSMDRLLEKADRKMPWREQRMNFWSGGKQGYRRAGEIMDEEEELEKASQE